LFIWLIRKCGKNIVAKVLSQFEIDDGNEKYEIAKPANNAFRSTLIERALRFAYLKVHGINQGCHTHESIGK